MTTKRVLITAPKPVHVYDEKTGLGGKYLPGALVELPVDVADILIGRGQAALPPQSQADHDKARQMAGNRTLLTGMAAVKEAAEERMRNHDALSPDRRLAAHDPKYDRKPKDEIDAELLKVNREIDFKMRAACPDASSTTTSSPAKSPGTKTRTKGSN